MLDLSLPEILVISLAAILVIGPKELPAVLRTIGRWLGQMRELGREVRDAFDSAIQTEELKQTGHELENDVQYIRDLEGNLQRTYDLSDLAGYDEQKQASHPPPDKPVIPESERQ